MTNVIELIKKIIRVIIMAVKDISANNFKVTHKEFVIENTTDLATIPSKDKKLGTTVLDLETKKLYVFKDDGTYVEF